MKKTIILWSSLMVLVSQTRAQGCEENVEEHCTYYNISSLPAINLRCISEFEESCYAILQNYEVQSFLPNGISDSFDMEFFAKLAYQNYTVAMEWCQDLMLCIDCTYNATRASKNSSNVLTRVPCLPEWAYPGRTVLLLDGQKNITNSSLVGMFGSQNMYPGLAAFSLTNTGVENFPNLDGQDWTNFAVGGNFTAHNLSLSGSGVTRMSHLYVGGSLDFTGLFMTWYTKGFQPESFYGLFVGNSFVLTGCTISGEGIQTHAFPGAVISGSLVMDGCTIINMGIQLEAFGGNTMESLAVRNDIFLRSVHVSGYGFSGNSFAGVSVNGNIDLSNSVFEGEGIQNDAFIGASLGGDFVMDNCVFVNGGLQGGALKAIVSGGLQMRNCTFTNNTLPPYAFQGLFVTAINVSGSGIQELGKSQCIENFSACFDQISVPYDYGTLPKSGGPFMGLSMPVDGRSIIDLSNNNLSIIDRVGLWGVGNSILNLDNNNIRRYRPYWYLSVLGTYNFSTIGNPSVCSPDAQLMYDFDMSASFTANCTCAPGTTGPGTFCDSEPCVSNIVKLVEAVSNGTYVGNRMPNGSVKSGDKVTLRCAPGYTPTHPDFITVPCLGGAMPEPASVCIPRVEIQRQVPVWAVILIVTTQIIAVLIASVGFYFWKFKKTSKRADLYEKKSTLHERLVNEKEEELQLIRSTWQIDWNDIYITGNLGQGSFGEVFTAEWLGHVVAVKCLHQSRLLKEFKEDFERESETMSQLRHPNITLFFGAGQDSSGRPFLVTEYMQGSLRSVLDNRRDHAHIRWETRLSYSSDIAAGMLFLHSRKPPMLHRDLKADNVLLDGLGVAKVADFGSIKSIYKIDDRAIKTSKFSLSTMTATLGVGTPVFTAPEVTSGKFGIAHYGPAADVYSYGMVLYEIASREVPFFNVRVENVIELNALIASGERPILVPDNKDPEPIPEEFVSLMQRCWDTDPQQRPTFTTITNMLRSL
eukprot:m.114869 g.114869  ORF g.114869 m.114869 type:complete len:979 (+) comp14182_c0_seq3:175-3111(+)